VENKHKFDNQDSKSLCLKEEDNKPGRKRSEMGRALCCLEEQRHQWEQPNQHEQELQPIQI